ncbi:MAG: AraC family transcriptional regulator [Propionibacteriaceae bacterium]|nr:AraC family transcriptional regulator [Propionibacteriaceae bacterium]
MDMGMYVSAAVIDLLNTMPDVAASQHEPMQDLTDLKEEVFFAPGESVRVMIHPPMWVRERIAGEHTQDFFELVYVYSGSFVQLIDGNRLEQTPDELVLLRPGAWHDVWTEHDTDVVFNILLRKASVEQILLRLVSKENPLYSFLFEGTRDHPQSCDYLIFSNTDAQRTTLNTLIAQYYNRQPDSAEAVIELVAQLFSGIARSVYREPGQDTATFLAADISTFLAHNCKTITQAQAADHFGYSPRHFSRLLEAAFGKSFPALINGYRIDALLERLEESNLPITQLATEYGFASATYFYEVFRRERGVRFADHRRSLVDQCDDIDR